MSNNNLKVLITRPKQQGLVLAKQLQALNIDAQCQPLFHYQAGASYQDLQVIQAQTQTPILIFISVAAVEFAQKIYPLSQWDSSLVISVGTATQAALKALNIESICPRVQNSEGVVNLPELSQVNAQDIIIIKGDGGRELITSTLHSRGANIFTLDAYQRVWKTLEHSHVNAWRDNQINCIVVTSNALLERVVHLVQDTDKYWQTSCLWITASERIAKNAQQLGLQHVVNAHGASDKHIINSLLNNGIVQ